MVLCYAGNVINGIIKVTIWYGNGEVMATRAMYSWSYGLSGIFGLTCVLSVQDTQGYTYYGVWHWYRKCGKRD